MMQHQQLPLPFHNELIIDNFAGGGGTSTGLEMAFGRPVDIAINHDPKALAMHALNHPYTHHICESVWDVDPIAVTQNRPVGLVWLSPDCKHFSKAKGSTPVSKEIRGLAWVGLRWIALTRPRILMLENVEEFQTWGPVLVESDGKARPDPKRRGRTFESFLQQLRQHGYQVDWRTLRACDYGAPTIRKRLFLVARRDGLPIIWPEQTHDKPTSPAVLAGTLAPYRTAAECIDFNLPAHSIFGRKKPLAANTQRRVAKGLWRHVLSADSPFIVTNTSGHPGAATDQPLPTVTTGNQQMLCQPVMTPFLTEHANASNQRTMSADTPLRTICAQVKGGHFSIVAANLITIGYGEREGEPPRVQDIEAPLGTVVTANKHTLVAAHLVDMGHGESCSTGASRWSNGIRSLETPLNSVTASSVPSALASAFFEQANGGFYSGDGRAADAPMSTITSAGSNQQLVTAYLVKYYSSGNNWQRIAEPMHTLKTKSHMGLVQAIQVPADTLSPEHRDTAHACAALLHAHLPEYFPELAELIVMAYGNTWWVLVNITLRMLKPRELYRAQGFPEHYAIHEIPDSEYLFTGGIQAPGDPRLLPRVPLSITDQIRMCGNSVVPALAEALARANFTHEDIPQCRVA